MGKTNTVVVIKLIGTLIEADQKKEDNFRKDEYLSRVLYCSRKINSLLEHGAKVIILGAGDHFKVANSVRICKDIHNFIDKSYINNIEYVFSKKNEMLLDPISIKDNEIAVVREDKTDIYKYLRQKYYDSHFILVDDVEFFSGEFYFVYKNYGEIHYIYNFFNSRPLGERGYEKYTNIYPFVKYPYCDNQTLINNCISLVGIEDSEEIRYFYSKYLSGDINLVELMPLTLLKKDLTGRGISDDEFKQAYQKGILNVHTSFESAYQKVLSRLS